jgi:hypothetical protein
MHYTQIHMMVVEYFAIITCVIGLHYYAHKLAKWLLKKTLEP